MSKKRKGELLDNLIGAIGSSMVIGVLYVITASVY